MKTFSERLNSAIVTAKLGKSELAQRIHVAPSAVSRWLRGAVPDIHNATQLARECVNRIEEFTATCQIQH